MTNIQDQTQHTDLGSDGRSEWILVPRDDPQRDLIMTALPLSMVFAGGDAYDAMKADPDLDLDSGMIAIGIYRAMIAAAEKIHQRGEGEDDA